MKPAALFPGLDSVAHVAPCPSRIRKYVDATPQNFAPSPDLLKENRMLLNNGDLILL